MYQGSFSKLVHVAVGSLAAVGLAALIGCAVGSDPGADVSQLDSLPVEAGPAVDSAATTLPTTTPHHDDPTGDDAGDDAGDVDAGGGGGGGIDAGVDSSTGGGVDSGGGGGGSTSCTSPNICSSGTDLGSISGDTGADVKTATGAGSQWFTIRVTENDNSITGKSLLAKAELVSPPGTNFDLFVYVAGGSSGQECSSVKASSTNASSPDSATAEWGESGLFSNGSDDSRTVSVEVRWVSGPCSAASPWTLTVRGDTP